MVDSVTNDQVSMQFWIDRFEAGLLSDTLPVPDPLVSIGLPERSASEGEQVFTATVVGPDDTTYTIDVAGMTEEEALQEIELQLELAITGGLEEGQVADVISVTPIDADQDGEVDSYTIEVGIYMPGQAIGSVSSVSRNSFTPVTLVETVTYGMTVYEHGSSEVDGTVTGASETELFEDAFTESVYTALTALLAKTGGLVHPDWTTADYVAFAFGLAGLSNLILTPELANTPEWELFKLQFSDSYLMANPDEMDFSMFDKFFVDGDASGLSALVTQGVAVGKTAAAMVEGGVTTVDHDTFASYYDPPPLPDHGRRLEGLFVPPRVYTLNPEYASRIVGFGSTTSTEGSATLLGMAASTAATVGVGLLAYVAFDIYEDEKLIGEAGIPETIEVKPTNGDQLASHNLLARVNVLLGQGDVTGAANLLMSQEKSGANQHVLALVLAGLGGPERTLVLTEIYERTAQGSGEPVDYFEALADGQTYSFLEDAAYTSRGSQRGALEGFLFIASDDPTSPAGSTQRGSSDLADRLELAGPDAAAQILTLWGNQIVASQPPDLTRLSGTLSALEGLVSPDVFTAVMTKFEKTSGALFHQVIKALNDTGNAADLELAASMLEALPPAARIAQFRAITGIEDTSELQATLGNGSNALFNALGPDAKGETIVYLTGINLAADNKATFLALDTPNAQAQFLLDLVDGLPAGVSYGPVTQASLLLFLGDAEAAQVIGQLPTETAAKVVGALYKHDPGRCADVIIQLFESEVITFAFDDAAAILIALLSQGGPKASAALVVDLNLRLAYLKGRSSEGLGALMDSPIWLAVGRYTRTLGSEEANFVASLSPEQAADYLKSRGPEKAAEILDQMRANGQLEHVTQIMTLIALGSPAFAAEVVEALSAEGAALVLKDMDLADAVKVAALLSDKRLAEVMYEMDAKDVPTFYAHVIQAYNDAGRTVADPPAEEDAGLLTEEQQSEISNDTVIELPDGTEEAAGTLEVDGEDVPVVNVTNSQGGFLQSGQRAVVPVTVDGVLQYRMLDANGDIIQGVAVIPPETTGGGWYAMALPAAARAGRLVARAAGHFRGVGAAVFNPGTTVGGSPGGVPSPVGGTPVYGPYGTEPIVLPPVVTPFSTDAAPSAEFTELTGLLEQDIATLDTPDVRRIIELTTSLHGTPEEGLLTMEQKVLILKYVELKDIPTTDLSFEFWAVTGTTSAETPVMWPEDAEVALLGILDPTLIKVFDRFGGELENWANLTSDEKADLTTRIYVFLRENFGLDFLPEELGFMDGEGAGRYDNKTQTLAIGIGFLSSTSALGVLGSLVHEMTHAFQDCLISELAAGTLPSTSPYYDWAFLLTASREYFREAGGIGSGHDDYTRIWEETSAFRAGDHAVVRASTRFNLTFFVIHTDARGAKTLLRGGEHSLEPGTYRPNTFVYNKTHWVDSTAIENQFALHSASFPETPSVVEYGDNAHRLFLQPVGHPIYERKDGDVTYRYNSETGEFAIRAANGAIMTYYILNPGNHTYDTNMEFFESHGSKGAT